MRKKQGLIKRHGNTCNNVEVFLQIRTISNFSDTPWSKHFTDTKIHGMSMKVNFYLKDFNHLTKQELYELLTLRQIVFVVEQNCPYLDNDGLDKDGLHLLGKSESNVLVAYVRILPPGLKYPEAVAITRVVNDPSVRGKGIGREIMRYAVKTVGDNYPGKDIRISAQYYLKSFYESFGFQVEGETYLEDGIPHIQMALTH